MKPYQPAYVACLVAALAACAAAVLVQPHNYMLDDSSLVEQPDAGSLSPFYNDQAGSGEQAADKDIVSILSERLARLRWARMVEQAAEEAQLGPEAGELAADEERSYPASGKADELQQQQQQSLSASVASLLANVAQAAGEQPASGDEQPSGSRAATGRNSQVMELDTSASSGSAGAAPQKSDLKSGSSQWFNPKETIPVLKISSMATPSKYKKVYFRSEKKLVDGAFHSPNPEQEQKKASLMKPFSSGVQRRSSRGSSTAAAGPQNPLQDGVIEFLRKFRDVYIQTRPVSSGESSSFGSSVMAAAASSPLAAVLAPGASGSRPNSLASALSAASSIVAQAAGSSSSGAGSSSSSSGSASAASGSASTGSKAPLTAQSYVSFWSKTFPDWVRKTLKQLRRRSLYNSRRHQQQHSTAIGQAAASGAVASAIQQATSSSASSSSSHH